MHMDPNRGWIEVITGCMYSGKTEELRRRIRRADFAERSVLLFAPDLGTGKDEMLRVPSSAGEPIVSRPVESAAAIRTHVQEVTDIIAVDEAHFFGADLATLADELAAFGHRVIVAGLDTDFRGSPFPVVADLMGRAELVTKLHAICVRCGHAAMRTQRLVDGRPAAASAPRFRHREDAEYEARCRACHMVPEGHD